MMTSEKSLDLFMTFSSIVRGLQLRLRIQKKTMHILNQWKVASGSSDPFPTGRDDYHGLSKKLQESSPYQIISLDEYLPETKEMRHFIDNLSSPVKNEAVDMLLVTILGTFILDGNLKKMTKRTYLLPVISYRI